ncbi:hypothetical protein ACOMHN_006696 [Nucella lapillus]
MENREKEKIEKRKKIEKTANVRSPKSRENGDMRNANVRSQIQSKRPGERAHVSLTPSSLNLIALHTCLGGGPNTRPTIPLPLSLPPPPPPPLILV